MAIRAILALGGLASAFGCSLTTTDFTECSANRDCQAVFGLGYTCNGDGLCEGSEPLANCTKTYPTDLFDDPAAHADTIVFGNLMDRSVETQEARENAAELAYTGANESGGLQGRDFGVVFCDIAVTGTETRADNAVEAATYLVERLGVPAILGPSASADVQAVFLALSSTIEGGDQVLLISPSATSPALTTIDGDAPSDDSPGLLWRTAPPDDLQGRVIAADLRSSAGLRSGGTPNSSGISVIFESGPYGEGLATVLSAEFEALCPACPDVDLRPFANNSERDTAITQVAGGGADEVVFISSNVDQNVAFFNAAVAASGFAVDGKRIFLPDSAANSSVLESPNLSQDPSVAGLLFDQVRGTRPKPLEQDEFAFGLFRAAYNARYGEVPDQFSFTANAYDAAWMLVYGATWALLQEGAMTGVNVARGLRRLSSGEDLTVQPTNYNTVRIRFEAGTPINLEGASGALDFEPSTEETSGPVETWQISGTAVVSTCAAPASDGICVFEP